LSDIILPIADYIVLNTAGVALDLDIHTHYLGTAPINTRHSEYVISRTEQITLDSLYTNDAEFVSITNDTGGNENASEPVAVYSLEASASATSNNSSVDVSYVTFLDCKSVSEMQGYVYYNNGTRIPLTGTLLYQSKVDQFDYFFTATGIFIWHKRREKLFNKVLFNMQTAVIRDGEALIGTSTGLYSVSTSDLLKGIAPTLFLDTTTSPALTDNDIKELAVDKLDLVIKYSSSFDYFKRYLTSTPLNFTGIMDGEVLNGTIYYPNSGVPTYLKLPSTSGALSGGTPIQLITFDEVKLTNSIWYYISDTYMLNYYGWLYVKDGNSYVKAEWLKGLPDTNGYVGKNFKFGGQVGDLIYIVGGSSPGDHMSSYTAGNGTAFVHTFRLSGTGEDTTAVCLDNLILQDYTWYKAYTGLGETEYYDQIAFSGFRFTEYSGNERTINFYVRPNMEATQDLTYGSLIYKEGYQHTITIDVSTGAITHTKNTITNTSSEFPALKWQDQHFLYNSGFGFRDSDTNELVYTGNEKGIYLCDNWEDTELYYGKGPRRFLSFDDINYDESTSSTPPVTLYDSTYYGILEILDILDLGDGRFITVELSADGTFYIVLYSKIKSQKRGETYRFEAITEPLAISKPNSEIRASQNYTDKTFLLAAGTEPGSSRKYIGVTGVDLPSIVLAVTDTAVIPVVEKAYYTIVSQDNMVGWWDGYSMYTEALIDFTQTTKFIKGKGMFFIDNNSLYCIFKPGVAQLVCNDCLDATVSVDAEYTKGVVSFKHTSGKFLTKSISAEPLRI